MRAKGWACEWIESGFPEATPGYPLSGGGAGVRSPLAAARAGHMHSKFKSWQMLQSGMPQFNCFRRQWYNTPNAENNGAAQ